VVVGHTHEDIDQLFSKVAEEINVGFRRVRGLCAHVDVNHCLVMWILLFELCVP